MHFVAFFSLYFSQFVRELLTDLQLRFCRILLIRESLLISSSLYHGAGSGFFTNYEDVGGPDSAILWAVGNPLASLPGYFSPIIAAAIKSSTGQYNGLFNLTAALQISDLGRRVL